MSEPTDIPFQDDDRPAESIYEGERPAADGSTSPAPGSGSDGDPASPAAQDASGDHTGGTTRLGQLAQPEPTETDTLAAGVTGAEDHEGMTQLWRATMDLPHWWFIAVGEPGAESPAAAQIDSQMMLLTFTSSERARHFAVQNEMVAHDEDLRAIALTPQELVDSAQTYTDAGIAGLMFDPHLSGYFIPTDQLPVVWEAVSDLPSPGTAADGAPPTDSTAG